MTNRYERSRTSLRFMYKGTQYHPGVLLVLLCQILCLVAMAFAPQSMESYQSLAVVLAFSLLFGLIRMLGLFGVWREFRDEVSASMFFSTNPVDFAIATATIGQLATILLMR